MYIVCRPIFIQVYTYIKQDHANLGPSDHMQAQILMAVSPPPQTHCNHHQVQLLQIKPQIK